MKRSKMEFLTPDELLAVLKEAWARTMRDWCMVLISIFAG
jgi:hypothetical protein